MPITMPYTTEKSPIFQVLEDYYNSDRARTEERLWDLIEKDDIATAPAVQSRSLDHGPYNTPALRAQHVNEHWWGWDPGSGGPPYHQPPFDPHANRTTGFWEYWYGDAEGIFRETLVRALCLSLGQPRNVVVPPWGPSGKRTKAGRRDGQHWPISFLWKCPQPFFEGWLEFKKYGNAPKDGHVTVVLSTPAHGVALYDTPIQPHHSNDPHGAYEVNPNQPQGREGLWVVSHARHRRWNPPPSSPSPPGHWSPPPGGAYVEERGPIVVVSPAVRDGGAAPDGIPYVP